MKGKLDQIRKKHQRDDLLLTGMGMEAVEISEEQRAEDIVAYECLIRVLERRFFDNLLEEENE